MRRTYVWRLWSTLILVMALILAACGGPPAEVPTPTEATETPTEEPTAAEEPTEVTETPTEEPTATEPVASDADLAAIKTYTIENAEQMRTGTTALADTAQAYYDIIVANDFDYEAAWAASEPELIRLVEQAREDWLKASTFYELDEGIIAGVPSLAYYDTWIDAGPPAADDPAEALEWELELPDGTVLESPGNFFHNLTEPALWGTNPDFAALEVDLNGDGEIGPGEVLPDANILLGAAQGLDEATAEMQGAVDDWDPTLSDAFTAMVVMVPTMNEYFEQWKLSTFVSGDEAEEKGFTAVSRLFDINGILNGLDVTYENVGVLVEQANPDLYAQIDEGFADLIDYVSDLYQQERGGRVFTAEEADLFGTEAQDQATNLAALVAQAADELNIEVEGEAPADAPAAEIPQTGDATDAATGDVSGEIVLYTTRSEALINGVLAAFNTEYPDVTVTVVRGSNSELGARILEEQENPQANVFINSDTLTMESLGEEGVFVPNDSELVQAIPEQYRADDGSWAALTLRGRVIMYNTDLISEAEAPTSLTELSDPQWSGKLGSADSTNGAMLATIVALNRLIGEEAATEWLQGLVDNNTLFSGSHTDIRQAVGAGEITLGLVNHYYYFLSLAEGAPVGIVWPDQGDDQPGLIVNSTNIGILEGTEGETLEVAETFVDFMLSETGQTVYAQGNFEWPIVEGIPLAEGVPDPTDFKLADINLKTLVEGLPTAREQVQQTGMQ
ncbi:MAG: extracellular solute-binding protein [Chloroflexales bacterium]|nr:extracellular solute-binding protein [Chloroflexales bacterium]